MKQTLVIAIAGLTVAWAAAADGPSSQDLSTGKKLYQTKCARCHKFYNVDNYPDPTWTMWLEQMIAKSRLTSKEADLLKRYLQTLRPSHPPAGTDGRTPQP